jgi:CPA1 family monovalent cation:H+ antiporter
MNGGLGPFDAVFNALLIVVVITLVARRINFPYTIALIFAGLLGPLFPRGTPFPEIGPEIFLVILLPPILFEETLTLDIDGLIDDTDTILSYAVLGTVLQVIAVASFAWIAYNFTVIEALILAIIVAPTDPVAVIATFRRLGVIRRFQLLVSGESLFNDGVAIVVYTILISIVNAGGLTFNEIFQISVISVLGGTLIGVAGGYLVHLILCWTDDKFAEVLLSFIIAFGVFRLAEELHASGVIATVLAGLIINYRCSYFGGMGPETMEMLEALWEFVGFIASSFAFIFIGLSLDPGLLRAFLIPVIGLILFMWVTRYFMVDVIARFLERYRDKRIPSNWRRGIWWSGLRGAVSVVLVLGINELQLPHQDEILALVYGVVLGTNILQGLSMTRVVKRLNLSSSILPEEGEEG